MLAIYALYITVTFNTVQPIDLIWMACIAIFYNENMLAIYVLYIMNVIKLN